MEYNSEDTNKFTLFVKTSPDSGSTLGYGFIHEGPDRHIASLPKNDFYIPVFLMKSQDSYEYVNITHDDTIFTMERQNFNPYFLEFEFFDGISRNKVNNGEDLTVAIINYIKFVRHDVSNLSNQEIKNWFDLIGKYELPWNKGTALETDLDKLDTIGILMQDIISKAKFLDITINK
jgi:hypothetical protein